MGTGQLFWPSAAVDGKSLNYADAISLRVFPRVLHLLYMPQLRHLLEYLHKKSTGALPSLLHLLLLYSNQVYLGILDFTSVEEYLMGAVLGGEEFQARTISI